MNDGKLSLIEKSDNSKVQPFVLTVLINVILIAVLAGPWIWASLPSTHIETPWHYVVETFRSVALREQASWNSFRGAFAQHTAKADAGKSAP